MKGTAEPPTVLFTLLGFQIFYTTATISELHLHLHILSQLLYIHGKRLCKKAFEEREATGLGYGIMYRAQCC